MKVNFLRVSGEGFLTFREPFVFDIASYDGKLVFVQGDNQDEPLAESNGAGKTNLMEAITFALFGNVFKNIPYMEDLINVNCKECSVQVAFVIDEVLYEVVRTRNRSNQMHVSVYQDDVELFEDSDNRSKQKEIERIVGLTFLSWGHCVVFPQDLRAFPDLKAPERAALLIELSKAQVFQDASAGARTVLDGLNKEKAEAEAKVNTIRGSLAKFNITETKRQSQEFEKTRAIRIKGTENEIKRFQKNLDDSTVSQDKEIDELMKRRDHYLEIIPKYEDEIKALADVPEKLSSLRVETGTLQERLSSIGSKLNPLKKELKRIWSIGRGACPYCSQEIDSKLLQSRAADIQKEKSTLEEELKSVQLEITDLNSEYIRTDKLAKALSTTKATLGIAKTNQTEVNWALANHEANKASYEADMRNKIEKFTIQLRQIKDEQNPYEVALQVQQDTHDVLVEDLRKATAASKSLEEEAAYYAFWVEHYIKLRMVMFDQIVEQIEALAQEHLNTYSSQLSVFINTERTTKSGNVRDVVHIEVDTPAGKVPFEAFGGGEKQKIRMAVSLALSQVLQNQNNREYNLLCFDEPNNGLDKVGKESNAAMFSQLAQDGYAVLLIDQDGFFKDMSAKTVTVRKVDGNSTIEV